MKLQNRETGKPVVLRRKIDGRVVEDYDIWININDGSVDLDYSVEGRESKSHYHYKTFKMFKSEWEDYEEIALDEMVEKLKSYFEKYPDEWNNLEDAKMIVKRLEALIRLKDKGFEFTDLSEGMVKFKLDEEYSEFTHNGYDEGCEWYVNSDVNNDLEVLFGVVI